MLYENQIDLNVNENTVFYIDNSKNETVVLITKTGSLYIKGSLSQKYHVSAINITPTSLLYDLNGNLISGDGKFRFYNSLNQLSKIYNGSDSSGLLLQEYTYHPVEERILVKTDYVMDETTYYWSQNFVTVVNSSGEYNYTYVYHNGELVAQELNGVKYYISGDHLGSSSVITDSLGNVVENTTYSPYGEVLSGGSTTRYGYEGKEHDSVVGDTDFNFRKYNPSLGIFTQPDTIIPSVYDPQSLNRYMFERGNPYNKIDPTGHYYQYMFGGILIAGAYDVGYLIGYYGSIVEQMRKGDVFNDKGLPWYYDIDYDSAVEEGNYLGSEFASAMVFEVITHIKIELPKLKIKSFRIKLGSDSGSNSWYKSTQDSSEKSLEYHYKKHIINNGIDMSKKEYTNSAKNLYKDFYNNNLDDGFKVKHLKLKDGSDGLKIKNKKSGEMGYYTVDGKIVSYYPGKEK